MLHAHFSTCGMLHAHFSTCRTAPCTFHHMQLLHIAHSPHATAPCTFHHMQLLLCTFSTCMYSLRLAPCTMSCIPLVIFITALKLASIKVSAGLYTSLASSPSLGYTQAYTAQFRFSLPATSRVQWHISGFIATH